MKSYGEIKEEELNVTNKYTDRQFSIYFNFFKILRSFFTEGFLWCISILIFIGIWSVFYFLDFFHAAKKLLSLVLFRKQNRRK